MATMREARTRRCRCSRAPTAPCVRQRSPSSRRPPGVRTPTARRPRLERTARRPIPIGTARDGGDPEGELSGRRRVSRRQVGQLDARSQSSQRTMSSFPEPKQGPESTKLAPKPSAEQVRGRFSRQRRTGTAPEPALRRELHSRGWRYRVDFLPLQDLRRRRADTVFTRLRVVIFVDGRFWHACPQHATAPKTNKEWRRSKLQANVARDRDTDSTLPERGWIVIRVWEHELAAEAVDRIEAILTKRRRQLSSGST